MAIVTAMSRAAVLAAHDEENNPFFAWENAAESATLDGGTVEDDGAAANAVNSWTNNYWKPTVDGTGIVTLEMEFDTAQAFSFAALVSHDIHTLGGVVTVQKSTDGLTWSDGGAGANTPEDSGPVAFRMDPGETACKYWRFRITGLAENDDLYVGVAFIGDDLVIPRRFYQGFSPIIVPTEITLESNVSEGGHYISSSVVRGGATVEASFTYVERDFIRSADFKALMNHFNEGRTFFFAWRPDLHPEDIHYCWRSGNVIRPENSGPRSLMSFSFAARAFVG